MVSHKQSLLRGNQIVFIFGQESIVRGQHSLGLAQAAFVVWQSDCATSAQEPIGTASHWSSTSNPCCVAIWLCLLLPKNRLPGNSIPLVYHKQSLLCGILIVLASAQESIARGQHPFGLAQAAFVVWQSDCARFCTRIDCQGRASLLSRTSNPCCGGNLIVLASA